MVVVKGLEGIGGEQTVHALALALVVSLTAADEEFEIVLRILDIADFVIIIDEVARGIG